MELQHSLHAGSYDLDVFRIALVAILVLRPASTPFPKSESFFSSSELIEPGIHVTAIGRASD
jgi:hypothetical protein